MKAQRVKLVVFLLPIAVFVGFLGLKIAVPDVYPLLIREDSIVEYAQWATYLAAAVVASVVSAKSLRSNMTVLGISYALLAVALVFVSCEEVSWGQRIIGVATPSFLQRHNTQGELTLHNVDVVQPLLNKVYILVGALGAFSWIPAALVVPRAKASWRAVLAFLIPEWFLSSFFFFVFFIYAWFEYICPPQAGGWLVWRDQEPMELLLSFGFLAFAVVNFFRLRSCLANGSGGRADAVRRCCA